MSTKNLKISQKFSNRTDLTVEMKQIIALCPKQSFLWWLTEHLMKKQLKE